MKRISLVIIIVVVAALAGLAGYLIGKGQQAPQAAQTASAATPDVGVPFDTPPDPTERVNPKYPEVAAKAGIQGDVFLKVSIDAAGTVTGAEVLKSVHPALDNAAKDAVQAWKFKPAMKDGKPVAVSVTIPFRFKLQEGDSGKKGGK